MAAGEVKRLIICLWANFTKWLQWVVVINLLTGFCQKKRQAKTHRFQIPICLSSEEGRGGLHIFKLKYCFGLTGWPFLRIS
jgi:hypothetical protein